MCVLLFVRIIVCLEGTKEQCDKRIFQRKIFNVSMIKKKEEKEYLQLSLPHNLYFHYESCNQLFTDILHEFGILSKSYT